MTAGKRSGEALLDAVALMDTLRRSGPWESTQTHESLRRYLIEETYELLDAIDTGSPDDLVEELGDLLLQVLFHARIAADRTSGAFDIDDVARSFITKVSGRTKGILSGSHTDLDTQIREWEELKAAEKKRDSVFDGIALSQPALALTQKILERLDAAGFPTDQIDPGILTVTVTAGGDSAEALARSRTLAFMDRVRAAEAGAAAAGIVLDNPQAWERYLD
ncbi:hydrolase [Gordonia amarae]|uniref:Hydrolase n=2 Tax=Gordonia amarae TaxID=36821 RepID=A0A857KW79_9ACTN|nr:XTP/dITP diphosphohydrolase [Gordonia amarae]GAB05328.1 putative hydrolase [Gordonia amarae NBRC 15530]QHN16770.1 hydrolase [Gordonia amarae]QHN21295.1 hydrolase [Gordonia amarae]QHN30149.1 hydrolase [Gordonia amarae]